MDSDLTGWLVLTRNDSVPRIVDALLDAPPLRAFTQTELAEVAGVSRQSVHRHLDLLLDAGILTPVPETSPESARLALGTRLYCRGPAGAANDP